MKVSSATQDQAPEGEGTAARNSSSGTKQILLLAGNPSHGLALTITSPVVRCWPSCSMKGPAG